jgi:hypothetical protein
MDRYHVKGYVVKDREDNTDLTPEQQRAKPESSVIYDTNDLEEALKLLDAGTWHKDDETYVITDVIDSEVVAKQQSQALRKDQS